jgi:hypothetical protein
MKSNKVGIIALAMALGSGTIHAASLSQDNEQAKELIVIKQLVNEVTPQSDENDIEIRLSKIRSILDNMSQDEVKVLNQDLIRCATE